MTRRHARNLCALALALTFGAAPLEAQGSIVTHALPTFGASVFDAAGNVYNAGTGGPLTPGVAQLQPGGGTCTINAFPIGILPEQCPDVHVTKIDSEGNTVFGTLLGGPTADAATVLAVDATGNVFIAGTTGGSLPTTANAAISTSASSVVFAAKLSADGSRFLYVTYLPAVAATAAAIALDAQGNAYVVGKTATNHAYVTKLSADGSTFLYTVTLAGSDRDAASAVAIDAEGNAVVAGQTGSADFPVTPGAVQPKLNGQQNLFVAKLDASGNVLLSTYFGGSGTDTTNALQLDAASNIYVAGITTSLDFPTTADSFQPSPIVPLWNNSSPGGFIVKFAADGKSLAYSSYVMSLDNLLLQGVNSLAVTASGDAWLAGSTGAGFPITPSAPQPCFGGSTDVFIAHLDPQGKLQDATYVGGPIDDTVHQLSVAADGSILLVWHSSGNDTFSRIRFGDASSPAPACLSPDPLNAATLRGFGAGNLGVAPGEIVTLTGLGIGPSDGVTYQPNSQSQIPLQFGGVQVFFDGQPAPVMYAQSRQVNVVAPFELNGKTLTTVKLVYNGAVIAQMLTPVFYGAPGLFRLQPGVSSQALARNQDGSLNSITNPAAAGELVTLLGAGFGPTDPACATGSFNASPSASLASGFRVSLSSGKPLTIENAGGAPGLPCGIIAIQIQIPSQTPSGAFTLSPGTLVTSGNTMSGFGSSIGATIAVK